MKKMKWCLVTVIAVSMALMATACGGSGSGEAAGSAAGETTAAQTDTSKAKTVGTVVEIKSPEYAYAFTFTAPEGSALTFEENIGWWLHPELTVIPGDMEGSITLSRTARSNDIYESNKESALSDGGEAIQIGDYEGYVGEGWDDGYLNTGVTEDDGDLVLLLIKRVSSTDAPDTVEYLKNADIVDFLATMTYDGDIPDKIVYDGVPDSTRVLVIKNLADIYEVPESAETEMYEDGNGAIYASLKYGDAFTSAMIHPIYSTNITAEEQAAKEHESYPDRVFENRTIGGLDCIVWEKDSRVYGYATVDGVPVVVDFRNPDDPEGAKMIQAMFDNMTVDAERWQTMFGQ